MGDVGSVPGSGVPWRSNDTPSQDSCLENPRTGVQRVIVHGVSRVGHGVVTEQSMHRLGKGGIWTDWEKVAGVALRHLQGPSTHLKPLLDAKSRPSGGLHWSGHTRVRQAAGVGRQEELSVPFYKDSVPIFFHRDLILWKTVFPQTRDWEMVLGKIQAC